MRGFQQIVALIAMGCAPRLAPVADGHWDDGGHPPEDPPAFSLRSIAGEYNTHAFFSWTALQIGADGRWTFRHEGLGGLAAFSSGTARISGECVVLEKNDAIGFPTGKFVVLTPIRWCERRYLLAPGDFAEFCNDLNWGNEPDRSMFPDILLRDEGAVRQNIFHAVTGPPGLPAEWLKKILRTPVVGVIRETLPNGRLRVDVGSADGVFQEMQLRTEGEGGRYLCFLRVVSFTEHECVLEPRWAPEWEPPAVGWKVTCDAKGAEFAPR